MRDENRSRRLFGILFIAVTALVLGLLEVLEHVVPNEALLASLGRRNPLIFWFFVTLHFTHGKPNQNFSEIQVCF